MLLKYEWSNTVIDPSQRDLMPGRWRRDHQQLARNELESRPVLLAVGDELANLRSRPAAAFGGRHTHTMFASAVVGQGDMLQAANLSHNHRHQSSASITKPTQT